MIAVRREAPHAGLPASQAWRIGSIAISVMAALLSLGAFIVPERELGVGLLVLVAVSFCLVVVLHGRFLQLARNDSRRATNALWSREQEFQSIFESSLDTILILDEEAICRDGNPAAPPLLGLSREKLIGGSIAQFYPSLDEFRSSWGRLIAERRDRGQLKFVRQDGTALSVEFTTRADFLPGRHLMILRDVTVAQRAKEELSRNLAIAKSAMREAEALREATYALTQELRLDPALDTLLEILHGLVPYEAARVLLLEEGPRLFLAREASSPECEASGLRSPKTLSVSEHPILERAMVASSGGLLIPDTSEEKSWQPFGSATERSWLGVRLCSANRVFGLLSLAHTEPHRFTAEHLRVAASLAVSVVAAVQNVRLSERAEIYGAELEARLTDLHNSQTGLARSEKERQAAEERFRKLLRSSPAAISVMTLDEERFVEVNSAFEDRFGYRLRELVGRTAVELGILERAEERSRLIAELRSGTIVRNRASLFRVKSGEWRPFLYSAETIQLNGRTHLLVVSDDLPSGHPRSYN